LRCGSNLSRIEGHLESGSIPFRSVAWLGLAFAMCILARTDQVLPCTVAFLALLWKLSARGRLRFVAVTGGVTVLPILLWFACSRWATGAWVQHSGTMKIIWAHREHTATSGRPGAISVHG